MNYSKCPNLSGTDQSNILIINFICRQCINNRMEGDKLPYISVIIIAYDRTEFLMNAIKSVLNQTLDKKYYEIIVIKNFQDGMIDNYILKNNIKGIISKDRSLSGKLIESLNIARGDILSFLEDDDLFSSNKLEIVYDKFMENSNLCYYHNGNIIVNDKYELVNKKGLKSVVSNLSSISIKKDIVNFTNLKKIGLAPDQFMYLSALESGQNIIAGKERLTHYMFHNSASNVTINNIIDFVKYKNLTCERDIKIFMTFRKVFISKKANNYIKQKITNLEIANYIFGSNIKPENVLNIFRKCDMSFFNGLEIFMAYFLVRLNNNFRNILIKKRFDYQKRT